MNISIFNGMTSRQPVSGTLEQVANIIRSDEKLKAFTLSYRQTGSKTFKNEALLFAVACLLEGGKSKENIAGLTGMSLVDFDHILSEERRMKSEELSCGEELNRLKAKIIADSHTLMCYTTISGNGLRVIFKYELPPEFRIDSADNSSSDELKRNINGFYLSAFFAGNAYYERLVGCKADMQCKNITRLSGLAHDPEVYLNLNAVPFTAEEIATASAAYAKQSKEDKQMQRIQTYYDTLIAPQLAKANIVFRSGSHNEYVMRVGYRLAERRFSKSVAVKWALQRFGADYPDTEQVVNSCFVNASSHGNSSPKESRGEPKFASVEEIKSFLDGHVSLRFNEITSRAEFLSAEPKRNPSGKESPSEFRLNSADSISSAEPKRNINGKESPSEFRINSADDMKSDVWKPVNDRFVNSLWSQMSAVMRVNIQDMYRVIESDYVPTFNPFVEYLNNLSSAELNRNENGEERVEEPPSEFRQYSADKNELSVGDKDYIRELADTVRVKGGEEEQMLWRRYLMKWIVGMVASWISDDVVNNVILVLIGEQGSFKTTWFNYLLPPPLKQYFYTKTNANRMSKDDLLTLAQYGLVCCEELDTMRPSELNQLKAVVTMPSIDERAAYAHFHEHRRHIASFCGTGNNTQFLSDPSGNRRWLPFEVESIVSPRDHPFHYEGIYAQALALYRSGFRFWFTKEEIQELNRHNRQFETPRLEHELVALYFRVPRDGENGMFMTSARAIQIVGVSISQKLSPTRVGLAFFELGFQRVRYHGIRGYLVVLRTAEEMQAYQKGVILNTDTDDAPPF